MQNYRLEGRSLKARNEGSAKILSGELTVIGDIVAVAVNDINPGSLGIFHTEGVYVLPKGTTEAIPVGKRVYLQEGLITASVSHISGEDTVPNPVAGVAWQAATQSDVQLQVKINV